MVAGGHACPGVCVVVGGACIGYDEIRSMSGRYASYWNAFLLNLIVTLVDLQQPLISISYEHFTEIKPDTYSPMYPLDVDMNDASSNSANSGPIVDRTFLNE